MGSTDGIMGWGGGGEGEDGLGEGSRESHSTWTLRCGLRCSYV